MYPLHIHCKVFKGHVTTVNQAPWLTEDMNNFIRTDIQISKYNMHFNVLEKIKTF